MFSGVLAVRLGSGRAVFITFTPLQVQVQVQVQNYPLRGFIWDAFQKSKSAAVSALHTTVSLS